MSIFKYLIYFTFLSISLPQISIAHTTSESYLFLTVHGNNIQGNLSVSVRDLQNAVDIDHNSDSIITWGEILSRKNLLEEYVLKNLTLKLDSNVCSSLINKIQIDNFLSRAYLVFDFTSQCQGVSFSPQKLFINYNILFDINSSHRSLLNLDFRPGITLKTASDYNSAKNILYNLNNGKYTTVFSPANRTQTFEHGADNSSRISQIYAFAQNGVFHILTGFDHLLFLISLLLPAFIKNHSSITSFWKSLIKRDHLQNPIQLCTFRETFFYVFKVITAFTLAHSITLCLAVLEIINLPSRLVESTIALSVCIAAINNIAPIINEKQIWKVAFVFGLIHGLGLSSVLTDIGLDHQTLAISLVSFNIGVEAGQMAVVVISLSILYSIRKTFFYYPLVVNIGSLATILISFLWFIERAFNLMII